LKDSIDNLISLQEKEIPAPKVNVQTPDIRPELAKLKETFNQGLSKLQKSIENQNKPKEWDFTVERGITGRITNIKAKTNG
jgi:hypothetical protein